MMNKASFFLGIMVSFLFALPLSQAGEDRDGGFRIFVKGQDQIYAFAMDFIRSLKECRDSAALHPAEGVHPVDHNDLSSGIEKLESARRRMVNWIDSGEEDVSKVAKRFSYALDDLISCWELMGKSYNNEKNVSYARLAKSKRETAYQKIREATPLIVRVFFRQDKAKPGLSKERLRLILQFCKATFQSALAQIEKRPTAVIVEPFASPIFVLKSSLEEAIEGTR